MHSGTTGSGGCTARNCRARLDSFFRTDRLVALRELAGLARRARSPRSRRRRIRACRAPLTATRQWWCRSRVHPTASASFVAPAEIAATAHADLVGVHVREPSGLVHAESVGWFASASCWWRRAVGTPGRRADEGTTIMEFVHAEAADHLVMAATRHSVDRFAVRRSLERALRSPLARPSSTSCPPGKGSCAAIHLARVPREARWSPSPGNVAASVLAGSLIVGPAIALAVLFRVALVGGRGRRAVRRPDCSRRGRRPGWDRAGCARNRHRLSRWRLPVHPPVLQLSPSTGPSTSSHS